MWRRIIALQLAAAAAAAAAPPPHLIMVVTDDLGYNFPGYLNQAKEVKTPTLDRLATKEGVRLSSHCK